MHCDAAEAEQFLSSASSSVIDIRMKEIGREIANILCICGCEDASCFDTWQ